MIQVYLPVLKININKRKCQIFSLLLQIEIDDVITLNPELAEDLPTAEVKENLPLQENVTVQVSALASPVSNVTTAHLKPGLVINNTAGLTSWRRLTLCSVSQALIRNPCCINAVL